MGISQVQEGLGGREAGHQQQMLADLDLREVITLRMLACAGLIAARLLVIAKNP
jgi:hypothetical protein